MKNLDGQSLKMLLISGSNNLYNHYPEVDSLNVFPVPDGDTGMNMNLTLTSGSKEIENSNNNDVGEIARLFSRGLLMGARGNSGVITSQIFRGFAEELKGHKKADAIVLAEAFMKGVNTAYKAVIRPVEGTILTVIRDSSTYLHDHINSLFSIEKALEIMISEAKKSLKRTPDLLPILKEVGVVDSGGAGLVYILEGMRSAAIGKPILRKEISNSDVNKFSAAAADLENEEFGYCTEFIMNLGPDSVKQPFDQEAFTKSLSEQGTSLVVVRDEEIVKVHVHTMEPGKILNFAQQFGEFLKLKIENMTEQHHALADGAKDDAYIVKNEDKPKSKFALIAVSSGEGIDEFFKEIGISYVVKGGQTMNPSSEDFVNAIKKTNAENIFIFPNNSNIVMAASQACEMIDDKDVNAFVIPSKTIPQCISSSLMFNSEATAEENFRIMKSALKNVTSGEVTFAIRDSEINGVKMRKNDFIGIKEKEIVVSSKDKIETLMNLLEKLIDDSSSIITLIYGEDVSEEQADEIKKVIETKYYDIELDIRSGKQPVYSFLIGVE